MRGRLSFWIVLGGVLAAVVVWGCQPSGGSKSAAKAKPAPAPTAADPLADELLGQVSKAPVKVAAKPKPVKVATAPKPEPPKVTGETPKPEPPKVTGEAPKPEPPKVTGEAPKPEPPAAAGDPRVAKLFEEMDSKDKGALARAEVLFSAGKQLFENAQFEEALEKFNEALGVYPRHQPSVDYAAKTRGILNMGLDPMRRALEQLSTKQRVEAQEALGEIQNQLDAGNRAREESRAAHPGDKDQPRDKVYSRQLQASEAAVAKYDRALEIIRYMPYQLDLSRLRGKIEVAKGDAIERGKQLRDDLSAYQRQRAQDESALAREREEGRFRQTIAAMLDRVRFLIKTGKYEEAEGICEQVLKLDPNNGTAVSLRATSRDKKHRARDEQIYTDRKIELDGTWTTVDEAAVPYSKTMVYPPYWQSIMRRTEASGMGDNEPEWMSDIRRKLEKKVNFEFMGASLTEAIKFLESVSDVNMIIDPAVKGTVTQTITLKMNQATLSLALEWILRLASLEYELRDNAVFISTPANLTPQTKMVIYDVQDLTLKIEDFPGPEMDLMAAAGAGGALPLPVAAAPVAASTPATIQDMITKRIRPDSWLPGKGTSIEERAGKLVVVQRPEVHRMISSLLTDLRQTQKIMVIVEGRLLTVREGLFEDIGVDWGTMGAPAIPTGTPGLRYTRHWADPTNITTASLINNNVRSSPDTTKLGSFIMGSAARPGFSGEFNFSHATLPGLQLMAVTHALRMKENGTELQAPKLIIHNGQRAHMWVGTQQAYTAGSTASGDTVMPTVNQLLLGVVFDVRPTVSADRRYITLEMRPTWTSGGINTVYNIVSSVTGTTATGVQPIATTSLVQTDLPDIMMTRVRTSVAIPDGGIILLGGRMRDVQWDSEAGLPVVKNVPFLGRLFRWNRKDNERENLAILVTARTLLFDEEEKKQL